MKPSLFAVALVLLAAPVLADPPAAPQPSPEDIAAKRVNAEVQRQLGQMAIQLIQAQIAMQDKDDALQAQSQEIERLKKSPKK